MYILSLYKTSSENISHFKLKCQISLARLKHADYHLL